jgi:TPR repeat protein
LGVVYEKGEGHRQDFIEAAKSYQLSADQVYGKAQCALGLLYELGSLGSKNYVLAYKWLSLESVQGVKDAAINKQRVEKKCLFLK